MAELNHPTPEPTQRAFAAIDRIVAQLPLLMAHAMAMEDFAQGKTHSPSDFDSTMSFEAVQAVAFWTGVLQSALCDIQLGQGPEGEQ